MNPPGLPEIRETMEITCIYCFKYCQPLWRTEIPCTRMVIEDDKCYGISQMYFTFSYWNYFVADRFIPLKYFSDRPYVLY